MRKAHLTLVLLLLATGCGDPSLVLDVGRTRTEVVACPDPEDCEDPWTLPDLPDAGRPDVPDAADATGDARPPADPGTPDLPPADADAPGPGDPDAQDLPPDDPAPADAADPGPGDAVPEVPPADLPPDPGPADPLHVGSAGTLEIATWNLHNFPSTTETVQRVAELILRMDLDLVALEEVSDVAAFQALVAALPGWDGRYSPDQYTSTSYQKTALLYRTAGVKLDAWQAILKGDYDPFPRPPLRLDLTLTRASGGTETVIVVVAHLKAGVSAEEAARRKEASQKLKAYLDGVVASGAEDEVFLVGDLNDSVADPASENVFLDFLTDTAGWKVLTEGLEEKGQYTYIPYKALIDHVFATRGVIDRLGQPTTWILALDKVVADYSYVDVVSDHRPVVAVFPF